VPERSALAASALLVVAVLAFGLIHAVPNRHLFPQNEFMGAIYLRRPANRDASDAIVRRHELQKPRI